MATRLIKKQLGSILLNSLLVPRISKPVGIKPLTQQTMYEYGLSNDRLNNNRYFVGNKSTGKGQSVPYIYKYGHPMTYNSDTKDGKHHKGDVRMKHISNLNEFKQWYCSKDINVLASLHQFSQSLAERVSASANNTESSSKEENEPNNEDDDNQA